MHKLNVPHHMESLLLTETKCNMLVDICGNSTPKPKKTMDFVHSPYTNIQKDLFSQLLGTDTKNFTPSHQTLTPSNQCFIEEYSENAQESAPEETEQQNYHNANYEEVRKRKRKSNAQIKLLKQEFDKEGCFSKQKIVKMAQVTGLSESQVYKWCWDQKKKNVNSKDPRNREYQNYEFSSFNEQEQDQQHSKTKQIKKMPRTKRKVGYFNSEEIVVNKKLTFN